MSDRENLPQFWTVTSNPQPKISCMSLMFCFIFVFFDSREKNLVLNLFLPVTVKYCENTKPNSTLSNSNINRTHGSPTTRHSPTNTHPTSRGVFVRIKDKNLHADCFKCATCGSSLKNQGYFNLNDKLYCDIHARLAALQSPPPGTNGMVPVTITKPYVSCER